MHACFVAAVNSRLNLHLRYTGMQPQTYDLVAPMPASTLHSKVIARDMDTAGLTKAREYAKLVVGSRAAGDKLIEAALDYFMAHPDRRRHSGTCFIPLFLCMRRVMRLPGADAAVIQPQWGKSIKVHYALPLEVREAAALHIAAEMDAPEIAFHMSCSERDVEAMLEKTWGTYLMLLGCCREAG